MSQDFAKLSYKELQALAVNHDIPRNIKKSLLVDFLRALKCGNKVQVSRMLMELKESRKRKVRKRKYEKLEKMTAVTSTPLHSPNYSSIDDRFYSPQHLSPYRWASQEEELRREDPHYERFRQYLIQKIQKNYQSLDTNNNDLETAALNLKAGALEYNSRPNVLPEPNPFLSSPVLENQQPSNYLESQSLNNTSENKPMILQKMLQAPLGTNLGAMARLEANRIWPMGNYHSARDVEDNNSDTVTADSESVDDECYGRMDSYDNKRSQMIFNEHNQVPQFNMDQMINYFQNPNGYQLNNQLNFTLSNIQENCQTWIENSLDYRGPVDYTGTFSADEQTNYQFQVDASLPMFSQNSQSVENNNLQVQNIHPYYQLPAQHGQSYRAEFLEQNQTSTVCTNNPTFNTNVTQQFNALQTQDSSFGMYPQDCSTSASFPSVENFQYSGYQQNQGTNQPTTFAMTVSQANGDNQLKLDGNTSKEGSNLSDVYWPKWTDNQGEFHLENVLNLNTGGTTDYTKFNQTSSVYCFVPPLSSPVPGNSSSQHVERAKFITAGRFPASISNSLVYSDSSTGMRMANLPVTVVEEVESEESSITVGYRSDDSYHPEPIHEIWIPDFGHHRQNQIDNNSPSSSCETISE